MASTTGALKKSNIFKVISALRNCSPLTKPEIVLRTGLTSATVHAFINELCEKGTVIEAGLGESSGGRKASLYELNTSCFYMIGVHVSLTEISASIYDLSLLSMNTLQESMNLADTSVEEGLDLITNVIRKLIADGNIPEDKIAGIGITVPGPVDFDKGIVNYLPNAHNWKNIPLKTIMESRLGIHTLVDKNNNGIMIYDKWTRLSDTVNNLVHISITDGVGSGIIINGSLFRGSHYITGEIGHMSLDPDGDHCNCGNRGCLELYVSNRALVKKFLTANPSIPGGDFTIKNMIRERQNANPAASLIFTEAADYLAFSIDNIIKMVDPDEIVIDCEWLSEMPDLFSQCVNRVFTLNHMIDRSDVNITLAKIDNILIKGSASLIYNERFGDYQTSVLIN